MKNIKIIPIYIHSTEVKANSYTDIDINYPNAGLKEFLGVSATIVSQMGANKYGQITITAIAEVWTTTSGKIRIYNNSSTDRAPSGRVIVFGRY